MADDAPAFRDVRLRRMTDDEYAAYMERMIPLYAAEGVRATGMSDADALDFARRQLFGLLPEGLRTPGHDFWIVEATGERRVGVLWAAVTPDEDESSLFLYDVVVDEEARGRGYGTAALRALAKDVRRRGLKRIALHVFEHNRGAIRLYERLGFRTTDVGGGGRHMTLDVVKEGPP